MKHARLDLFALANIGPTALMLWGQSWLVVALLFCGGNSLWIVLTLRHADVSLRDLLLATAVMTIGGCTWAWLMEPAGQINNGLAWDGRQYASMYWYFARGVYWPLVPAFPYSQRVGLPFVAAHLPFAPDTSFLLLHVAFWIPTMLVFSLCCRRCFRLSAAPTLFAVLWVQVLWCSVPRGFVAYHYHVDSAALFFIQAWTYVLLSRRSAFLLPLIAFVGVLFKETMLLVVVLSIVCAVVIRVRSRVDFSRIALAVSVVAAVAGKWLAGHTLPYVDTRMATSAFDTVFHWYVIRTGHPGMEITRYVAAICAAYGGFVLLPCATVGRPRDQRPPWPDTFAVILSVSYLVVCFVAGSDLTRFAYSAFPFLLPVLLREFDQVRVDLGLLALGLGLPAAHAFGPIPAPAPGHDLPNLDIAGLYSWTMEYAHPALVWSWIGWWVASVFVLRSYGFASYWRPALSIRPAVGEIDDRKEPPTRG
jgi:hypothetical protein